MLPYQLLILLVLIEAAIIFVDRVYRRRRARVISSVGETYRMNYSPLDRFGLTERLMTMPQWTTRAADLTVKDVLYATRHGMRCFVATVKCRWSLDEDRGRFIVRIDEPTDHGGRFEIVSQPSTAARDDVEIYRTLLDGASRDPDQPLTGSTPSLST